MATPMLAVAALLALVACGLVLLMAGRRIRWRRGLGHGVTLSLDKMTLTSKRLGLTGRPDRLYRNGGRIVIEEWKTSRSLQHWHVVQLGVYFLLAEERFKLTPPYGFLVTGDGKRHRIDNTPELRADVLAMAARIREQRAAIRQPIAINQPVWKCRPCGMRGHCHQARG